jgi:putative flippase GtrA
LPDRFLRGIPPWAGEVVRFGFVGLSAFALDYGVLAATVHFGASPYAGRVLSMALATVLTWVLNRWLTFKTSAPPSWREFGTYAGLALAGIAINYTIYSGVLWAGGGLVPALVLGTGIAAVFNFWRYRSLLGDK